MDKLSDEVFLDVVKNTPLVAIDLVVQNQSGQFLSAKE